MGNSCSGGNDASKLSVVEKVNHAFFDALPSGVMEATIDHVYDGDTLTIQQEDRARVRLLGIDAPELKEKEPFAQESADYVKRLCPPKSRVWLRMSGPERTDRYNRLLAYVFIANPEQGKVGYICVNIALLQNGLATYYAPSGNPGSYKAELMQAQVSAMKARTNLWKKMDLKKKVFRTANGIAFHRHDCKTLEKGNPANLKALSMGAAFEEGYSPCRECKPV